MVAAATWLKSRPDSPARLARSASAGAAPSSTSSRHGCPISPAGVPFYGTAPAAAEVAKIKAPLLIHYAGNDERVNAGWPAFEAALKENNVPHEMHVYAGAQHGFNNDTTPRFDAAAAKLAWARTVDFFNKHSER